MRIYKWKKPAVIVSKGTGGTLSPGTYYVWGYNAYWIASFSGYYGTIAQSPRPEPKEVVLGLGETSITVQLEASGNITSITNAGGGKINITSAQHCLKEGDSITVTGTTSYNGTYNITDWVDYNNFKVAATFIADEAGDWTTRKRYGNAGGMVVYIYNNYPFDANGDYVNTNEGTNHMYYAAADSITISSYGSSYSGYVNLAADCNKLSIEAKTIITKGLPYLYGTESSITDASLNAEFISAGMNDICELRPSVYLSAGNPGPLWHIGIHMNFPNLIKTVTGGIIKLIGYTNLPLVTFDKCQIEKLGYGYALGYNYGIEGGWSFKLSNSQLNFTRNAGMTILINNVNKSNIMRGVILSDVEYLSNTAVSAYGQKDNLGSTRTITNSGVINGSFQFYGADNVIPVLKNFRFYSASTEYDFFIDNATSSLATHYVNVDSAREDNQVLCRNLYNFQPPHTFTFYREKLISVYDENGDSIPGATVTITQNASTYTGITDASGIFVSPYMLEQINSPIISSYYYNNTIYKNWTLDVNKEGYSHYKSFSSLAKDIEEEITLSPVAPPVYYQQQINGSIFSLSLTGSIFQDTVYGSTSLTTVTGYVDEDE